MSQQTSITVTWEIKRKPIPEPTLTNNSFAYTGSQVTPVWESFSSNEIDVSGDTFATAPGTYTAVFTPKSNWCWIDGTTTAKTLQWVIEGELLPLPTQANTLTYSGSEQEPTWNNFDNSKMTLSGVVKGTNAGDYTAIFTPEAGCTWSDGTTTAKNIVWSIGRQVVTEPAQSGSLTYSGSEQTVAWNSAYSATKFTKSGTEKATNAGSYTTNFTPTANYCWSDGTYSAKAVTWTIAKMTLVIPTQSGSLTYNAAAQSPSWSNKNDTYMTVTGNSQTNAGTHTATFKLKDTTNTQWTGGVITDQPVSWVIGKATATISISPTTLTFSSVGSSAAKDITVTSGSTGAVTATSSATSKATVSVTGKTVKVTPVADGSATITISIAGDSNYTAPSSGKTCSVTVTSIYTGPSKTATSTQFQSVIKAGKGSSTFAVGDLVGIPINGSLPAVKSSSDATAVPVNLSGTYYAPILGFNHNSPTEGSGNYVDLQFLSSADGATPLCFGPASGGYQMNTTNTSVGGPGASKMYTTTLPALLQLIDSGWRNTFIEATKYVDTNGNSSNVAANVNALKSILFLLAEFEIFGTRTYANQYEKDKQKQYAMYANGASKIRKSHVDGTTAKVWWESSPYYNTAISFCTVYYNGSAHNSSAGNTYGLAPGFRIG